MMSSTMMDLCGAIIAIMLSIVIAEPVDPIAVKTALVAWAQKNVFSLDPSNVLEAGLNTPARLSTKRDGWLKGVSHKPNTPPTTFLQQLTAKELASQLKPCKLLSAVNECTPIINDAIAKLEIQAKTVSCAQLADDMYLDESVVKLCSLSDEDKILRGMIKYLEKNFLHEHRRADVSLVQFFADQKCFRILGGWDNGILKEALSVNDVVQNIPECKSVTSAEAECLDVVQQFVDRMEKRKDFSCSTLAKMTKNGRAMCSYKSAGW